MTFEKSMMGLILFQIQAIFSSSYIAFKHLV